MKKLQNATVLPPAPAPVTERPESMSFEDYKNLRRETNKAIKERVKHGFLAFLSNEILMNENSHPFGMRYRRGLTFNGSTKMLQIVS